MISALQNKSKFSSLIFGLKPASLFHARVYGGLARRLPLSSGLPFHGPDAPLRREKVDLAVLGTGEQCRRISRNIFQYNWLNCYVLPCRLRSLVCPGPMDPTGATCGAILVDPDEYIKRMRVAHWHTGCTRLLVVVLVRLFHLVISTFRFSVTMIARGLWCLFVVFCQPLRG